VQTNCNVSGVIYKRLDFLGCPDYRVGTDGSVWSRKNNRWGTGKWHKLKPLVHPKTKGVRYDLRTRDGWCSSWNAAHLVLTVFVGPRSPGMEACHFPDRDRTNNHLDNLRWDTHAGNERDKIAHGTLTLGERNGVARLTDEKVREMRRLRERGWKLRPLAKKYGVGLMTVSCAVRRKSWPHIV
jgi:hypothetical protein